jgi:hypothetical protein
VLHQIAHITRDKNALQHDDRLDALASACRYWVEHMGINQQKVIEQQREREHAEWLKNPLGYNHILMPGQQTQRRGSAFNKYRR